MSEQRGPIGIVSKPSQESEPILSVVTRAPIVEKWIFADTRGPSLCKKCRARIVWAELVGHVTVNGTPTKMPFDQPLRAYRSAVDEGSGRPTQLVDLSANHWATCPYSDTFRRRVAQKARGHAPLLHLEDFMTTAETTETTAAALPAREARLRAQGELLPPAESTPINGRPVIDTPPTPTEKPVAETPAPVTVQLVPGGYADMDKERGVLLQATIPSITSVEHRDLVNSVRLRALAFVKAYKPKFDEVCRDAKSAHTKACELRDIFIGSVERFEAECARAITTWERQEQQARRDAELAEQRAAQEREIARMKLEAKAREAIGDKEGAKAIRAMPVQAPPVVVQPAPPKPAGLSMRTDWKWRPVAGDTPEGRALAEKVVPRAYMTLDEKKLNAHADTTKGQVPIPGIEFFSVDVPVRR